MNIFLTLRCALLLLACSLSTQGVRAGDSNASPTTVRIGGSGGPLASMHRLAEAFQKTHPQARIVIVPSLSSGGGIKALRAGAIDLALISRPLTDSERGPDIVATEYARTPFVFATATRMGPSRITTAELISIYVGQRTTWPDGRTLRLVLRPKADSDTDITKSLSPEMSHAVTAAFAREGLIIATTDQASADSIETVPGAIGTTTLAQIISEKRGLQALALDGVMPSLSTLADGQYPYYKTFFVATGLVSSPLARQFAEFLQSPAGRQLLQKTGHGFGPSKSL